MAEQYTLAVSLKQFQSRLIAYSIKKLPSSVLVDSDNCITGNFTFCKALCSANRVRLLKTRNCNMNYNVRYIGIIALCKFLMEGKLC